MKKLAIIGLLGAIGSGFLTFWFWWEGCDSFPCIENLRMTKMILIGFISSINAYLLFFFYMVYHKEVIGQFPWSRQLLSKGVLDEHTVRWQPNSIHTYSRVRYMCYFAILCSIGIGLSGIMTSNYLSISPPILREFILTNTEPTNDYKIIAQHIESFYIPTYLVTGLSQLLVSIGITFEGFPTHKIKSKDTIS